VNDAELPDNVQPDADEAAFDDGSTDWVRDLLADARVTGPIPEDVAARLDDTIASLQAERQPALGRPEPEPRVVVPLRRRLAPLLAAAAVVVVIGGVAVGQLVGGGADQADRATSADSGSSLSLQPDAPGSGAPGQAPQAQSDGEKAAQQGLPALTTGSFPQDAARVMRSLSPTATPATGGSPSADSSSESLDELQAPKAAPPVTASPGRTTASAGAGQASCPGPALGDAVALPATLDGTLVALVFQPPTATAQQVEAWSCDGATLLATASVPH
jgi:hypothetical protein